MTEAHSDGSPGRGCALASASESTLVVERALRSAARAGNRMLAAGRVLVAVSDPDAARRLQVALERMGARAAAAEEAEFVFVDRIEASDPGSGPNPAGTAVGATVIGLDGGVRAPRGLGAAERIAYARGAMGATASLAGDLRSELAGRSPRVALSLVLEPKTAALALQLADLGCEVAVFAPASETDTEVAGRLAEDGRIAVFAPLGRPPERPSSVPEAERGSERSTDATHAEEILDWGPEYLIDDGSRLIRLAHDRRDAPGDRDGVPSLGPLRGAAEETTSGVRPLRAMAARDELRIPVIAVNDARTKTGFDNLIGTGQSCVFAIADLLDAVDVNYSGINGTRWVVFGYGPVGVGTARFAAALGASVTVVERDPVRALSALHDGHEACSAEDALPVADVVVSATGVPRTVGPAEWDRLGPGAVVAVAGGVEQEIALDELRAQGWRRERIAPSVDEWTLPAGAGVGGPGRRSVIVLADGGGVNYTAAEGNPIEVMDLSFATQLAALRRLVAGGMPSGLHVLGEADESLVADAALASRGGAAQNGGTQKNGASNGSLPVGPDTGAGRR